MPYSLLAKRVLNECLSESYPAAMVMFICGKCGGSLRKNQVDSHLNSKCRGASSISCMDCLKDFYDDSYADHMKCMTENQKYGGSNYIEKEFRGEKKQEEWINNIHETIRTRKNLSPNVKSILNKIVNYGNIPRKQKKFRNFLISSMNLKPNDRIIDDVWKIFDESNQKKKEANNTNGDIKNKENINNGSVSNNPIENTNKKKRKLENENGIDDSPSKKKATETTVESENGNNGDFKWKVCIKKLLKDAPENKLKEKKLRKKVFEMYTNAVISSPLSKEEMLETFKQKLNYEKFIVKDSYVYLKGAASIPTV